MPREAKGPYLYLEPEREKSGKLYPAVYVIRDGRKKTSTKCGADAYSAAKEKLEEYKQQKYINRERGNRHSSQINIADVLTLYMRDKTHKHARPKETDARIERLLDFFGDKTLDYISGPTCRAYAQSRKSISSARRELEDLRAAIRHHRMEGLCDQIVEVPLPEKSAPRERWLSRSEAAQLLFTAWRRSPHVARFILAALYTGSRSGAICGASLTQVSGRGFIDTNSGIFYRKAFGKKATKKRQPPVVLPDRLLSHVRRWEKIGLCQTALIEFNGEPILRITKAFDKAVEAAGLENVTPHTLRHTAATWMKENGCETSDVANFLGMTEAMVDQTYGHIGSKAMTRAAQALTRK
jgi:integrase